METLARGSVLLGLYTLLGLPYGYTFKALPVILKGHGFSETSIGLGQLPKLLWSVKVFWAWIMDTYYFRSVGKHRTWLIATQLAILLVCIFAIRVSVGWGNDFAGGLCVLGLNLFAASLDIIADSLSVVFKGFAATEVIGYNIGMAIAGGWLPSCTFPFSGLCEADGTLGPTGIFFLLAICAVLTLAFLTLCGNTLDGTQQELESVDISEFWRRFRAAVFHGDWYMITFVFLYQFAESGIDVMWGPFLVTQGQDAKWVAALYGIAQFPTILCLSLVGLLPTRHQHTLQMCLTVLQGIFHLIRLPVASSTQILQPFYFVAKVSGTLSVLLTKYRILPLVDPTIAATHYSFYSMLEFMGKTLGPILAGPLVEQFGYEVLFLFGFANSMTVVWLLRRARKVK